LYYPFISLSKEGVILRHYNRYISFIVVLVILGIANTAKTQNAASDAHLRLNHNENKISLKNGFINYSILPDSVRPKTPQEVELLNKGYNYINQNMYNEAITSFSTYLNSHPEDMQVQMQVAYLYDRTKKYEKAYNSFSYVANNSDDPVLSDKARVSAFYMRDLMVKNSPVTMDFYFYNYFDSYYSNYVANLLTHLNVRLTRGIWVGPYLETYLDSKSTPENILNDRFFEIGGFSKFQITDWMNFEFRMGYVREIDYKKNSFNFKPILAMGKRVGEATFYKDRKSNKTENFYFDVYAVGLYDHKFKNFFSMLQTKEVLRILFGGYSNMEFYAKQEFSIDSKQLDYNNYVDLGAGISFKPNIINFPVLFVEALSRNYIVGQGPDGDYFSGDMKSLFTVRVGFLIYYTTKL
jgi:hypothetical protein